MGKWHPLTIDIIKSRLFKISPDVLVLSRVYVNSKTPLRCKCATCLHHWKASWNELQFGRKCPRCTRVRSISVHRLTNAQARLRLEKANPSVKFVGPFIDHESRVKCSCRKCKHRWSPYWYTVTRGSGCPKCATNQKLTTAIVKHKLKRSNPSIKIIGEYFGQFNPLPVLCLRCGHKWSPMWSNLSAGCGCPQCNQPGSVKEQKVRRVLKRLTGCKFPRSYPAFLCNRLSGRGLELDGYSKYLKLAFEYQGEQHYRLVDFNGKGGDSKKKLARRKSLDRLKRRLCRRYGVRLLVISYRIINLEQYIIKRLNTLYPEFLLKGNTR